MPSTSTLGCLSRKSIAIQSSMSTSVSMMTGMREAVVWGVFMGRAFSRGYWGDVLTALTRGPGGPRPRRDRAARGRGSGTAGIHAGFGLLELVELAVLLESHP